MKININLIYDLQTYVATNCAFRIKFTLRSTSFGSIHYFLFLFVDTEIIKPTSGLLTFCYLLVGIVVFFNFYLHFV